MRRRQADNGVVDAPTTQPTVVAGTAAPALADGRRTSMPWPTDDPGQAAATAGAAGAARVVSQADGPARSTDDLTAEPAAAPRTEPAAAPRPVGPRITRPEPISTPIGAAALAPPPVEHQRSFIRTATIAAVLLSFGALIGFVGADMTRDAREGRGVLAAVPTTTPVTRTTAPSPGATTVPSLRPSSGPAGTPAPSVSSQPSSAPPPVVGPAMAPPVTTLGNRLTSGGIELDLAWQAPADGSAVSRYDLRAARDAGDYGTVSLARKTARSATIAASADHDYAFQVRARATDGTPGAYADTAVRLSRVEESGSGVHASSGWKIAKFPAYSGAGARYATKAGAELTLAFDGTGIAIVGPKGPGRGRADVFVDDQRVGRFDADANRFRPVQLLFTVDGLTPGPHVVTVRVAGTPGRPMVAVDRFLVLSQR